MISMAFFFCFSVVFGVTGTGGITKKAASSRAFSSWDQDLYINQAESGIVSACITAME
jgi:hypothetical protein